MHLIKRTLSQKFDTLWLLWIIILTIWLPQSAISLLTILSIRNGRFLSVGCCSVCLMPISLSLYLWRSIIHFREFLSHHFDHPCLLLLGMILLVSSGTRCWGIHRRITDMVIVLRYWIITVATAWEYALMSRSVIGRSLFPLDCCFSVLLLELIIWLHFLLFGYINDILLCRSVSLVVQSSGLLPFLSLMLWLSGCRHLNHNLVSLMGGKGRLRLFFLLRCQTFCISLSDNFSVIFDRLEGRR